MVSVKKEWTPEELEILGSLKNDVKKKFKKDWNKDLLVGQDFEDLADEIEKMKIGSLDESTLRKIWESDVPKNYTSKKIKSILSQFKGYDDWDHYVSCFKAIKQENGLFHPESFKFEVEDMIVDQEYTIGWYPQNFIKLKYLGKAEFEILDFSSNQVLSKGEIREIHGFGLELKPIPIDIDDYLDKGEDAPCGYPLYPTIKLKTFDEYVDGHKKRSPYLYV